MSTRRPYKVRHLTGSSDVPGEGHFAVRGPRVNEFAVADQLARTMQQALNASIISPREWKVIRSALAMALAGITPREWTQADVAAAQAVLDRT